MGRACRGRETDTILRGADKHAEHGRMTGRLLMALPAVMLILALAAGIAWMAWEGLTAIIGWITG